MPPPTNCIEFLNVLRESRLLEPVRFEKVAERVQSAGADSLDAARLAQLLIKSGLLTRFQAEQLLAGRSSGFFVNKYKVLDMIGAGGMAKVYLAEHTAMKRQVALKILPKVGGSNAPAALARFRREARAVAALNHPNIVQAYDFDQTDGLFYIVMEFVRGMSVQQYVAAHGPIHWSQAADYVCQAAAGLQHAHQAGLIHRDIKPGNLLVDTVGTLKVLDLGLAVFFEEKDGDPLTLANRESVLGTADYLAPEQAINSHEVDIRADVYSLGGTFYYMLTGCVPFPDTTVAQKLVMALQYNPRPVHEIVSNVPGEIEAVLEQMMAKNVADRFQSPAELVAALQPFAKRISTPFDTAELERLRIGELAPVTSDALRRAAQTPNTSDSLLRPPSSTLRQTSGRVSEFAANVETPSPAGGRTIVVSNPPRNSADADRTGPGSASQGFDKPAVPKKILVGGGVAGVLLMIVVAVVFGGLYSGSSSAKLDGGRSAKAVVGDLPAKSVEGTEPPTKKESPALDAFAAETTDSPVVVSEFMFNPNSNEGDFNAGKPNLVEWVEIYNRSNKPVDLSGWVLFDEDGPCDPLRAGTVLAPRAAAVLCPGETPAAEFRAAWGSGVKILPVGGWNQNMRGLSNNPSPINEILALKNASGQVMDVAHYDDEGQWPKATPGASLYLRSTAFDPVQNNEGRHWAVSVDGEAGAFRNLKTPTFDQTDVGSPGVVETSTAAAVEANHCAAVVYRKAADPAAREVLLVSPIKETAWGLPVGPVIPGFSASASAVQESFDQAGVRTKILSEEPIGSAAVKADGVEGTIPVFALEVVEELPSYPGSKTFQRKWATVAAAQELAKDPAVVEILRKPLPKTVKPQ